MDDLLLETGDHVLQEDNTSLILLEQQASSVGVADTQGCLPLARLLSRPSVTY